MGPTKSVTYTYLFAEWGLFPVIHCAILSIYNVYIADIRLYLTSLYMYKVYFISEIPLKC